MSKNLLKIASVFFIGAGVLVSAQDTKGKVGINTENPSATLNVKSLTGKDASTKNFELENASSTKMVTVLDDGKVGVNTEKPSSLMELTGLDNSYNSNMLLLNTMRNGSTTNGDYGYMDTGMSIRKLRGNINSPEPIVIGESLGGLNWVPYVQSGSTYGVKTNAFKQTSAISSAYMGLAKDRGGSLWDTSAILIRTSLAIRDDYRGIVVKNIGYVGINTKANTGDFLPAKDAVSETLTVNGAIKVGNRAIDDDGTILPKYTALGSTPSTPRGGAGTFIYDDTNNHFYGYVGGVNKWIQLDNEASSSSSSSSSTEVKVPTNQNVQCNAANAGLINFGNVTTQGKTLQAFGFCMKDASDKYRWFYIYGASNVTSGGEGTFGAGL